MHQFVHSDMSGVGIVHWLAADCTRLALKTSMQAAFTCMHLLSLCCPTQLAFAFQVYILYIGLLLSALNRLPLKLPQKSAGRRHQQKSQTATPVSFDDVAGVDEAKEELAEIVVSTSMCLCWLNSDVKSQVGSCQRETCSNSRCPYSYFEMTYACLRHAIAQVGRSLVPYVVYVRAHVQ